MFNFFYDFVFTIASLFILIKAIYYGIYEIKAESNKYGGIVVICFSFIVTLFANVVIWIK